MTASVASLLAQLEQISRSRPDRVLRLCGELSALSADAAGSDPELSPEPEPFELLIFRGFSSSITHPTAFDPDRPLLPEGSRITAAELLAGPLDPSREQRLAGPAPVEGFLSEAAWL